eukprot:GHVU01129684.1.p1 GENE.GHVU01129684.1~~GHVU01129684.1.p1  ORF type:complete len:107 (+),score=3.18 GHVU01129684.1:199-519(+)
MQPDIISASHCSGRSTTATPSVHSSAAWYVETYPRTNPRTRYHSSNFVTVVDGVARALRPSLRSVLQHLGFPVVADIRLAGVRRKQRGQGGTPTGPLNSQGGKAGS